MPRDDTVIADQPAVVVDAAVFHTAVRIPAQASGSGAAGTLEMAHGSH
jgi:hypothetical protein